jgi:cytochrome b subunit of formate dehydrogenase
MAIFGLTLLIVGIVLPSYVLYVERANQVDLMAKVREADMKMIASGAFRTMEDVKGRLNTELMSEEDRQRFASMIEMLEINSKGMDELRKSLARTTFVNLTLIISVIFIVSGIILITSGFRLWYKRLQIYQDIIIRNEAKASRRKLASQDNRKQEENTEKANSVEKVEDIENE